jgi:phytoene desaturase
MSRNIAVVGAGVGGLATAARLSRQGFKVEVYEKLPECGGRAHIIEDKGFKFDTGPSFVLMPDFFKEVFSYCQEDLQDHLDLRALDTHYKIFYPDGSSLSVFGDIDKTKEEFERIEPGSSSSYDRFIGITEKFYNSVKPLLYKCFLPHQALNPAYWPLLFKLEPFSSYWQIANRFFKSDKLCYALTFEAMFIGVSPFNTPAFYSIITYADYIQKIYHPMGGMYTIPKALEALAGRFGAGLNYSCPVRRIIPEKGAFCLETDKGSFPVDQVVVNADYAYSQEALLGRRPSRFSYSCSVFLLYLGLKGKLKGLEHHNLFFARDLEKNLKDIFYDKRIPEDFSFYIHVPTVTDPGLAPPGKEILYILIPVPNLEGFSQSFEEKEDFLRRAALDRIDRLLGIETEDLIEVEHRFYPRDFVSRYNVNKGATFGLAHTLSQSAFLRPANIDQTLKNLYFVGASTQPGGGLPPVIASSRIVADLIKEKVS